MKPSLSTELSFPTWLPDKVRLYLDHTGKGVPIRELARRIGAHPSTVMRKVRRCELWREDPLVDEALSHLGQRSESNSVRISPDMMHSPRAAVPHVDEDTLDREARRILRRLAEPGSVLAIATDMDKAAVLKELPDGNTVRTGIVDRSVAQAFVLKDWIVCRKQGRIATYEITASGRATLKQFADIGDSDATAMPGLAEAATPFADRHRAWDEKTVPVQGEARRIRYNAAESPITLMGRRKDKDGKVFLDSSLVRAGERLREDFELAQMGPRVAQNWERFLTGGERGSFRAESGSGEGPAKARDRVAAALRDLGPGLGDVALRVCCFLEGIETAEKRMGWASRSGKIVLRIALQRLKRHYDETYGPGGRMIG